MALGTSNPYPRSVGSFQVPVAAPDTDPDSEPLATICFSEDWLPAVLGALQQLTLQATWLGDADAVQLAVDRAQLLLSMFGSSNGGCVNALCISGVVYDEDCDCILWTPFPGADPVENPGLDPRHSDDLRFPPNTADDPKCQAAANMVRFISDLIDEVILIVDTAGTAEGLVAILLPFFVELGPFGILIDIVLGLAFLLFSAGATAIAAAFTSDVYDTLTCIFFCHVRPDGTVTAEQLESILAAINTQIGGLVYTVLSAMFFLMGEVGLSNAGAKGDAPADCSECECLWCKHFDFTADDGGFSVIDGFGVWTTGVGWEATNVGGSTELLHISQPIDMTNVKSIFCTLVLTTTNSSNNGGMGCGAFGTSWSGLHTGTFNPGGAVDINIDCMEISAGNGGSGHFLISDMTITGVGDNPFGADNC